MAFCGQCGFLSAGNLVEADRQLTHEGHKLDSHLLNAPVVSWAKLEGPYVAPGRPPTTPPLGYGPGVLGILFAVAAKEWITCLAYSYN